MFFSKDVFTPLPPGSLSSSFPSESLVPYLALSLVTLLNGILASFFLTVSLAASLAASLVDSLAASLTPSLSHSMVPFMAPSLGSSLIHSLLSSPPLALSTSASVFCIIAIIFFYIFKLGSVLRNKRCPLVRKGYKCHILFIIDSLHLLEPITDFIYKLGFLEINASFATSSYFQTYYVSSSFWSIKHYTANTSSTDRATYWPR